MQRYGIDVSSFNGEINWELLKPEIEFVIIRCGFGNNLPDQDDPEFRRNADACTRLGIPFGVYLYSYATSTADALSEAEHVLRLVAGYRPDFPIYYDLEDEGTVGAQSNDVIADIAKTFCDRLEQENYFVGVYANKYWFTTKLTSPVFNDWVRWVAQYNSTNTYNGPYGMWQYTDRGRLPGIENFVDRDIAYDDYPAIIRRAGKNGFAAGTSAPAVSGEPFRYTVKAGDTLSEIALQFGTTVAALVAANPEITNPDLIYPGQVIRIPRVSRGGSGGGAGGGSTSYTVRAGDTLSEIAQRYGTTVAAILAANPEIQNPNLIYTGQVITIPAGRPRPQTYTVRAGDTLSEIAQRYGTTVAAILAANPTITNPDLIYPGQIIVLS